MDDLNKEDLVASFDYTGKLVPAVRVNFTGKWTPSARRYHAYREDLTRAIIKQNKDLIPVIPPTAQKTQYNKWLKEVRAIRYYVSIHITLVKDVGDVDNYMKGIMDSLQKTRLIHNDKQIRTVYCDIRVDPTRDEDYLMVSVYKKGTNENGTNRA